MPTKIQWCDETINPITGCTPTSEGCVNCYAANMARRFWGDRKFSDIKLHPNRMDKIFKWKKPKKIFIGSMGDLFHHKVKVSQLHSVFNAISISWELGLGHIFIILTKRPKRMKKYIEQYRHYKTSNLWLGVTAENQKRADERVPILLQIPAAVRFVSVEPMLSRIDLSYYLNECPEFYGNIEKPHWQQKTMPLSWIICGAETGPGARPMNATWAIGLYDQCKRSRIPYFFKKESKGISVPDHVKVREFPVDDKCKSDTEPTKAD